MFKIFFRILIVRIKINCIFAKILIDDFISIKQIHLTYVRDVLKEEK